MQQHQRKTREGRSRISRLQLIAYILTIGLGISFVVGYLGVPRVPHFPSRVMTSSLMDSGVPGFYNAIETSQEALQKSIERFPAGHNPHGEITRLLDVSTYESYGASLTDDIDESEPIWVVGILGDNLTVDDVLLENAPVEPEEADERAAIGAKYIWSASTGLILADLVLIEEGQYDAITSLPNLSISITPAAFPTPLPTFTPAPTSTPTPTSTP